MVGKDGTSGIGNGHLRTGMQFQFRYRAAAKPDDAKILDIMPSTPILLRT